MSQSTQPSNQAELRRIAQTLAGVRCTLDRVEKGIQEANELSQQLITRCRRPTEPQPEAPRHG